MHRRQQRWPRAFLWILSGLFLGRVTGQLVQRWWPQTWLPQFDRWQGSGLPYSVLLACQVLILALMLRANLRAGRSAPHSPSVTRWLFALSFLYMAGSLARLAVGLLAVDAPAWFSAWISGVFHVVLASYLFTWTWYRSALRPRRNDE